MNRFLYKSGKSTICILCTIFLSLSISAQTRRALIIGIGVQKDASWTKINGDNDVSYVQQILKNAGYTDVRILVNKQATKAAIVAAFKKLAVKCKAGDIIYVQFSGHGQLVTDVNGDEQDGWDEAWIPYDAYLKYGKKDKGEEYKIVTDDFTITAKSENETKSNAFVDSFKFFFSLFTKKGWMNLNNKLFNISKVEYIGKQGFRYELGFWLALIVAIVEWVLVFVVGMIR